MATNSRRKRARWLILVIILSGGSGLWLYRGHNEARMEYQTVRITRGELIQAVTATGTLNPILNVQVGSQISGIIQKLYADFNSIVTNGQVIAQLDSATYRANVSSAEGDLANANASLELAEINARRAEKLFQDNLIAQSDNDTAVVELHRAQAQVKMRNASLERARVDLARCTIYAPVDGIVIDRKVDVGQTVAASLSAPVLFQIANDLTKMQINANVAEADIGGVAVGQAVEFTVDAFPTRTFSGRVMQVRNAPITLQNVVTYDAVIEVNNDDLKLKPGMTANVSIVIERRENVLKLANAALRFRPPESSKSPNTTNNPAVGMVANRPAEARGFGGGGGGEGGRRGGGGGGGDGSGRRGGGGGEGGARRGGDRPPGERQPVRTVYLLMDETAAKHQETLKPVQIKTGISDGIFTEVIEGVSEGDAVVTSATQAGGATTALPQSNPFGGSSGFRRF